MILYPQFEVKSFGGMSVISPNVTYAVRHYSFHSIGGPLRCEIEVVGDWQSLWMLAGKLREPVTIKDETGAAVWWGFVNEVEIVGDGITLDGMANEIRVLYQDAASGSPNRDTQRVFSDWVIDSDSVNEFGSKQLTITYGESTLEGANNLALSQLGIRKNPIPLKPNLDAGNRPKAIIYCLGWWSTLAWQYYQDNDGLEFHDQQNNNAIGIGDIGLVRHQSINPLNDIPLSKVRLFVSKAGNPLDNFIVRIRADILGSPGAIIDQANIPASSISEDNYQWLTFPMLAGQVLNAGNQYWIEMTRSSGLNDPNNYFEVGREGEEGSYKRGTFYDIFPGTPSTKSLLFYVVGENETSEIIRSILDSSQFVSTSSIIDNSGVSYPVYRSGEKNAHQEILELLNIGTDKGKRYLSSVSPQRTFSVFEEPAQGVSDYSIISQGLFKDPFGNKILMSQVPMLMVGNWAKRTDITRGVGSFSRYQDASYIFSERINFDARTGRVSIYPRAIKRSWDAV